MLVMKNLVFIFFVIVISLFSCNKDREPKTILPNSDKLSQVTIAEDDGIHQFINGSWLKGYFYRKNLVLGDIAEKYQQGNRTAYRFTLKKLSQRSNEETGLVVYSYYDTRVLSPILVTKEDYGSYSKLQLTGMISEDEIAEAYIASTNDSIWGLAPCPDQGLGFQNCMMCALNDITSDLVGWVACATCPSCCLIASGIACGVLLADNNSNVVDLNSWINENVGSDKYFKEYVISDNKYIVN